MRAAAARFEQLEFVIDRFDVTYGPSSPVLLELAADPAVRGTLEAVQAARLSAHFQALEDAEVERQQFAEGMIDLQGFELRYEDRADGVALYVRD